MNGNGRVNFRDVPHCLEQVEEETYATKKIYIYINIKKFSLIKPLEHFKIFTFYIIEKFFF